MRGGDISRGAQHDEKRSGRQAGLDAGGCTDFALELYQ